MPTLETREPTHSTYPQSNGEHAQTTTIVDFVQLPLPHTFLDKWIIPIDPEKTEEKRHVLQRLVSEEREVMRDRAMMITPQYTTEGIWNLQSIYQSDSLLSDLVYESVNRYGHTDEENRLIQAAGDVFEQVVYDLYGLANLEPDDTLLGKTATDTLYKSFFAGWKRRHVDDNLVDAIGSRPDMVIVSDGAVRSVLEVSRDVSSKYYKDKVKKFDFTKFCLANTGLVSDAQLLFVVPSTSPINEELFDFHSRPDIEFVRVPVSKDDLYAFTEQTASQFA